MLSFFRGKKKVSVLGLDIGSKCTKLVHLIHRESLPSLVNFATILEVEKSDPKFEHHLRDCLQKNSLNKLAAAFSLEDASFKIRKIELPKMPDADVIEAVKWKMRDVVDGNIEDFIVRSSSIATTPDGKRQTLVGYAAKKMAVAQTLALADRLHLDAQWIEPTAINLSAAIEACANPDEEWVAGIDLGESKSILVILGNGRFYFSRPLAGISLNAARNAAETFKQKLAAEIQNSLDTFAVTFHVEHISRLYLAGGGSLDKDLTDYLSQNLGVPTSTIDTFKSLEIKKGQEKILDKAPLFAMACALARVKL